MKKTTALLMIAAMVTALFTGCGSKQESVQSSASAATQVQEEAVNLMEPAEAFAGGDGSEADPYQISTAEELYRFAYVMDSSNFELGDEEYAIVFRKMNYVLTEDIVVNDVSGFEKWETEAPEYGWIPVKTFSGHFDGQGHTISGLYCTISESADDLSAGFFSGVYEGSVENLQLENVMLISQPYGLNTGLLTGFANASRISNCHVSGKLISNGGNQGGVIGAASWAMIDDCSFAGSVTCEEGGSNGGIAGSAAGCAVSDCTNEGTITAARAGGIVGMFSSTSSGPILDEEKYAKENAATEAWIADVRAEGIGLKNCVNTGAVHSMSDVAGGIAGNVNDGLGPEYQGLVTIADCVNEGAISSDGDLLAAAAGICGEYSTTTFVLDEEKITGELEVVRCINRGDISAKEMNVAGILGQASMKGGSLAFDACANEGTLTSGVSDGFITHIGGIAATVSVFEGVQLRFENITDRTVYDMKEGQMVGGIVGAVTVAESKEEELSFVIRNCKSLGQYNGDKKAVYGALCGNFMEGVMLDDFEGVFDVVDCECTDEVPAIGNSDTIIDKLIKLIKAVEAEE